MHQVSFNESSWLCELSTYLPSSFDKVASLEVGEVHWITEGLHVTTLSSLIEELV